MKDSYPASKLSYLGERSEPRENARASRERPRKGEPQMMSHEFSDEGRYHWLKMTFRISKLIDNRLSWPARNFRGKRRNTMLLFPKPVLCRRSLNSLRKRRPAEEENRFLLL